MDITSQLKGLDRFLTAMYEEPTSLAQMLDALGLEPRRAQWLCEQRMPHIAVALVEALRRKLTAGEKDRWFRVLNSRYGLDGEPPMTLEQTAAALGIEALVASQAQTDALQKCRTKTLREDLKRQLHRIALDELAKGGERPEQEDVAGKLTRLADLRAALDLTRLDFESKRQEVLKSVQAELDALEAEYQPLLDAAGENASSLEAEIKNDVLLTGQSVMTDVYQAIYVRGRVTWDNDGLGNYARQHPEVLKYRKEGNPNVTLRTARK